MSRRGIAVVTGGAKRMGAAIVRRLASSGWDVCVHYNTSAVEVGEMRDFVRSQGRDCAVVQADLTIEGQCAELMRRCVEHFGSAPTALVNNAAAFEFDTIQTLNGKQLQRTLDVNLIAPLLLIQAFAGVCSGAGCIVNLLDQKIRNLNPDFFSYTVSKMALGSATPLLARALAPVRVCGVAPGISLPSADQSESEFRRSHSVTPLGASSTPEDIADAVLFLLESKSITGEVLTVDGGQHLLPLDRDIMFLQRALSNG